MAKVIKLTESDLVKIVKKVIKENEMGSDPMEKCLKDEVMGILQGKDLKIDPADLMQIILDCNPSTPNPVACGMTGMKMGMKYIDKLPILMSKASEFPKIIERCGAKRSLS